MNNHDRGNLDFILSLSTEEFDRWYQSIDLDDLEYAIELCQAYRSQLIMNSDNVKHTTQAKQVLQKFML